MRRVVLPGRDEAGFGRYEIRARILEKALVDNQVDAMVYHAWASPFLLWDMLVVKGLGLPFVVNTHSVFFFMQATGNPYFAELPHVLGLCDAVVSLSRVDLAFWSHYTSRAFYLPNPLTYDPRQVACARLDSQDVLWVGRFAGEKRPLDAIRIIAQAVKSAPAARLLMLGKAATAEDLAGVEAEIERLGMREHVVLCGYHKDVGQFYAGAAVYLSTSRYEGFPTGLAESKSHGLPCVMYDLPYLEMVRDGAGLVTVPQGDVDAAANAVAGLLRDEGRRAAMGAAARASIEKYSAYDLAGGWSRVLEAVTAGFVAPPTGPATDESAKILIQVLLNQSEERRQEHAELQRAHERAQQKLVRQHERLAQAREQRDQVRQELKILKREMRILKQELKTHQRELNQVRGEAANAVQMLQKLRGSLTFRVGKLVMRVPVWVYWKAVRCKRMVARLGWFGGSDDSR